MSCILSLFTFFALVGMSPVETEDAPLIVAVTADGPEESSQVVSRFGQTSYFTIVDARSNRAKSVVRIDPYRTGCDLAYELTRFRTNVVITGKIGPNALEVLKAAKIKVIQGVCGTGEEAIDRFVAGDLKRSMTN